MILAPAQNAQFQPAAAVILQWQADELASTYDFGLFNPDTDSTAYNSGISASDICTATSCELSTEADLTAGEGYQLLIRANNSLGSSEWSSRTFSVVNDNPAAPPTASFTLSATNGVAPLTVSVDASGSTDALGITEYLWEFSSTESVQGSDLVLSLIHI